MLLQHFDDLRFSKSALAHVRLPKERTLPKNEGIQVARPPIERVHGGHVTSILVATLQERALGFIYNEFRSPGFALDGQRFSDMLDNSRLRVGSDFKIVILRRV